MRDHLFNLIFGRSGRGAGQKIGQFAADLEIPDADLLVFVAGTADLVRRNSGKASRIQARPGVLFAVGLLRQLIEALGFVQDHVVLGVDLPGAALGVGSGADAFQRFPQRVPFDDGLRVLGRIFGCPLREDLGLRDPRLQGEGKLLNQGIDLVLGLVVFAALGLRLAPKACRLASAFLMISSWANSWLLLTLSRIFSTRSAAAALA